MNKICYNLMILFIELSLLSILGYRYYSATISPSSVPLNQTSSIDSKSNIVFTTASPVKAGSYKIVIQYMCDSDQTVELVSHNKLKRAQYSDIHPILYASEPRKTIRNCVFADCDSIELIIHRSNSGIIFVNDISMTSTSDAALLDLEFLFVFFAIFNVIYLLRFKIKAHIRTLAPITAIVLISSIPLAADGLDRTLMHDVEFHLMRIEGLAVELSTGHFPVRLESLWAEGYGYANSVFYGDILLYFPALLRLFSVPVDLAYKLYVLFINFLTCVISYYSFQNIFKTKDVSFLLTLIYSVSSYRFVNVYVRAAVGEYSAMAFLPVIFLVQYKIYTETDTVLQSTKKYALLLAFGMTGLIQTHLLSTEMTFFVMLLICLIFPRKTFSAGVIKLYLSAFAKTVLLNLFFIVPFFDYYFNVPTNISQDIKLKSVLSIQHEGVDIARYFFPPRRLFGGFYIPLTPGFLLMTVLILGFAFCVLRRADRKILFFTAASVFLLFIASNLFPWDYLSSHTRIFHLLSQIQFPWRFLGITTLFLTVLAGMLLVHIKATQSRYLKAAWYISVCICLISLGWHSFAVFQNIKADHFYDTADLNTDRLGFEEYLPVRGDKLVKTGRIMYTGLQKLELIERRSNQFTLYVHCLPDQTGMIDLPVYNYKGYQVTDDYGNLYAIDHLSGTVAFRLPASYEGHIFVSFKEPWYWRVSEIISLSFLSFTLCRIVLNMTKKY